MYLYFGQTLDNQESPRIASFFYTGIHKKKYMLLEMSLAKQYKPLI